MGKLFVIVSAVCFGYSNAYWKKAIVDIPLMLVIFYRGIIASAIFGLLCMVDYTFHLLSPFLGEPTGFNSTQFIYSVALCIFSGFGLLFFVRSLRYALISIVVPLSSVNIFSILTATFVLKEAWKNVYYICIGLTITGVWLLFSASKLPADKKSFAKSLYTSLLASFFWGISYALFKIPIRMMGPLPFSFLLELTIGLFAMTSLLINGSIMQVSQKWPLHTSRHYWVLALLVIGGTLSVNLGMISTPITEVNILSNASQLVALAMGYVFYREKLTAKQWLGVMAIISSIVLISLM